MQRARKPATPQDNLPSFWRVKTVIEDQILHCTFIIFGTQEEYVLYVNVQKAANLLD
jgi:hypothetical protein